VADDIARGSATALPVVADVLFARAAKGHMTSVLHLVPRRQWPFSGPLPWAFDQLCGVTVGVERDAVAAADFGDRMPAWLVIDPALVVDPLPAASASCVDAFEPIVIDAALSLATVCASLGERVWLACSDPTPATLAARATKQRVAMLVEPAQARATDTVVVIGELTPPIHQLAARGVRLLRPRLATSIAARIAVLIDLRAGLAAPPHDELVDPMIVPAAGQFVVDDPQCPMSVVDGGAAGIAPAARIRTRALWRGRGRL
jgi:hypothetical protein